MLGLKDALKRLYSGDDTLVKHIFIFILTGVLSMLAIPLNVISKTQHLTGIQTLTILGALIVTAIVSIYMGGYGYEIMHNSHDEYKTSLLPDFKPEWFKVFFKGFPLAFAYGIYEFLLFVVVLLFTIVIGALLGAHTKFHYAIIAAVSLLISTIYMLGIPFVFAKFTKNYERKGLYNPVLPIKFICKTFKDFITLILKFSPLFIIICFIGILGKGDDITSYLFTALWAYLYMIMQYSANFCYVQIYNKHFIEE